MIIEGFRKYLKVIKSYMKLLLYYIIFFLSLPIISEESSLEFNLGYWTGTYKQSTERMYFIDSLLDDTRSYNFKWNLLDVENSNLYPLNLIYYKKFMKGAFGFQTNYYTKIFDNISYQGIINTSNDKYNLISKGSIIDWDYGLGFKFGILTERLIFFPTIGVRNYFKSFNHRFVTYGKDYNTFSTGGKYSSQNSHLFYKVNLNIEAKKDLDIEVSFSDTLRQKVFLNDIIKSKSKFSQEEIGRRYDKFFFKSHNSNSFYESYILRFSFGFLVSISEYFKINFGARLEQAREVHPKYNSLTFLSKAPYLSTSEVFSDKAIYQTEFISKKQGLYVGTKFRIKLSSSRKKNSLNNSRRPNRYKDLYKQYR